MSEYAPLLPLLAVLVLFWLMVIRPQQRRQKAVLALQESLQVGQRVMLTSGIFGTISSLTDERIRLEIAPGQQLEVLRAAIAKVEDPTVPEVGGA